MHSPKIAQLFAISALSVRGVVFSSSDFSDSVMCISLIEIGNLAEFWLRLQYIGRRVSQVSVECALLNTSAPTFPYFVFHILLAFRYLCVFLIDFYLDERLPFKESILLETTDVSTTSRGLDH